MYINKQKMTPLPNDIKLIVGLGNPSDKYKNTRHNIGFIAIDEIAEAFEAPSWKQNFGGLFTEVKCCNQRIVLLKPMSYMNNSGGPVQSCASFYKIRPEEILVIHDELDIPLSKIKTKIGGGNGGHNGIKSIESRIGKEFHRLRIGIGRPEHKDQISDYVLSNFSSIESEAIDHIISNICMNFRIAFSEKK